MSYVAICTHCDRRHLTPHRSPPAACPDCRRAGHRDPSWGCPVCAEDERKFREKLAARPEPP